MTLIAHSVQMTETLRLMMVISLNLALARVSSSTCFEVLFTVCIFPSLLLAVPSAMKQKTFGSWVDGGGSKLLSNICYNHKHTYTHTSIHLHVLSMDMAFRFEGNVNCSYPGENI